MNGPILVGVDGSETGTRALDWAAGEARVRKVALRLLHALPQVRGGAAPGIEQEPEWGAARRLLDEAEERVRRRMEGVETSSELVVDDAAGALVARARDAGLVVVGTRGSGGLAGLVLGSVAFKVAAHAPVSVALAPALGEPTTGHAEIVAGVDGPSTGAVLAEAFREAALWRAPLRVVHAFRFFQVPDPVHSAELAALLRHHRQAAERRIEEALADWRTRFPEVQVTAEVVNDSPRKALLQVSAGAQLVVVGPHDHRDPLMPLGSVAYTVIHRCGRPVLIARPA